MNFRVTLVLVVLVVVVGGYLLFRTPFGEDSGDTTSSTNPWFFLVDDVMIDQLAVNYFDEERSFFRDEERVWHIGSLEGPPVGEAFQGTPFLASGARSPRLISEDPDADLEPYGLDDVKITMYVHLEDDNFYTVLLGDLTPDTVNNYAQIENFPEIYLLDRTWGEHMARLVTETPVSTPTPAPE